ncbi:MAG: hypothetical protein SFU99_19390 [Saprospiraceae bacterium]|nr:hypothetical protein [Saprospiraceae bacterium]
MNLDTLLAEAKNLIQFFTLTHWAIIGGVLLLLFVILPLASASRRRKRRAKVAPQLILEAFQVSPLGRDAFLKIKNNGETATFTSLFVKSRRDIVFKNAFAGHQLDRGKTYSVLLEAVAQEKITHNFSIELTYFDQMRNVYRQTFDLSRNATRKPKLVQAGG